MAKSAYCRVSAKRRCRICGKPDWCSFTPDEKVSFCARVTAGSDRISRTGWGIFHHGHFPAPETVQAPRRRPALLPRIAPVAVRDLVYKTLIELSPAADSDEIAFGPNGLAGRGIRDFLRFGYLPQTRAGRSKLARRIEERLIEEFPELVEMWSTGPPRIPGLWRDASGQPRLGPDRNNDDPMLLIPYRDELDRIQACQIRVMSRKTAPRGRRYFWLSGPARLGGASCGTPPHFARFGSGPTPKPLLVTEGALKAESIVGSIKDLDIVAVPGVACSHDRIIAAARGRLLLIGFDRDMDVNPHVARAVTGLLRLRRRDQRRDSCDNGVGILMWDDRAKGIDDAILAGLPIHSVSVEEWTRLTGIR